MAKTFTAQAHLPPAGATGTGWSGNGEPLSTHVMRDMMKSVNNLWMIDKPIAFLRGVVGYIQASLPAAATQETFVGQSLMYVPPNIRRLAWRAGIYINAGIADPDGADGSVSLTHVSLYAMNIPYAGVGPTSAFDTSVLPAGYAVDAASISLSASGRGVTATGRIDRSATGVDPMPDVADDGYDRWVHLIVTTTGTTTGAGGAIRIQDCCIWGEKT